MDPSGLRLTTNLPNWNSPGPAQNSDGRSGPPQSPQGQPQQGGVGSANLYDPHRTDIDQGLQKQTGFPGQVIIGGLSGIAFGGPVPWALNHVTDGILKNANACRCRGT